MTVPSVSSPKVFALKKVSIIVLLFAALLPQTVFALTCSDLEGASIFSSEDAPVYLGFLGSEYAMDSVHNEFGTYGSEFSSASVRNTFGNYGGSFSNYSAFNDFALSPPKIVKYGKFLAYLSTNAYLDWQTLSLPMIDESCSFFATSPSPQFEKATSLEFGWGGQDASFIGSWYNPDRDGEGIVVDFYTGPGIILYFYTYDLENNPIYLVGATEIPANFYDPITMDVVRTRGTSFGENFNKDAVIREPWGTLTLQAIDCESVRLDWNPILPGFTSGGSTMIRIVPRPTGITCP